ncbi:MAG TPA: ribosome maturation factor RimM [Terriglobia bacterium]|nr:ribosome maturation factor RimM [Terriglobia bacterium]
MQAHPGNVSGQFLAVARIARPQGRRGEVAAELLTDFPERFETLRQAYLESPGRPPESCTIESCWFHKGRVILKIIGVDSIEAAERLRGRHVLVPQEEKVPLPEHQYYVADLVGCRVVRQGTLDEVGTVIDVDTTGGASVLRVALSGAASDEQRSSKPREALVPLAQAICTRIDTAAKLIVIDPPENLLDVNL